MLVFEGKKKKKNVCQNFGTNFDPSSLYLKKNGRTKMEALYEITDWTGYGFHCDPDKHLWYQNLLPMYKWYTGIVIFYPNTTMPI